MAYIYGPAVHADTLYFLRIKKFHCFTDRSLSTFNLSKLPNYAIMQAKKRKRPDFTYFLLYILIIISHYNYIAFASSIQIRFLGPQIPMHKQMQNKVQLISHCKP